MKNKLRLFLLSNLVAASLLTAACAAESPAEDAAEPGVGDTTQFESTPQLEEPVVEATAPMVEEPVAEATTEMAEEPIAEATTEMAEEPVAEATTEMAEEPIAEATTEMAEEPIAEATTEMAEEPLAEATTEMGETTGEMAVTDISAAKASVLIGHTVRDLQGEDIGEIEDLVIGLDSDQVRYAVLSFGGFLDIGDKLFAIPTQAFQFDHEENVFVLDVTEEELESAPGFDANTWPDTVSPDWDADIRTFWNDDMMGTEEGDMAQGTEGEGAAPETDQDAQVQGTAEPAEDAAQAQQDTTGNDAFVSESAVRASELLDFEVENAAGEVIGEVEDIIVELDTGVVQNIVFSFDDEIDNSEDYVGLQLSQLNFTPENDALLLEDQSLIQSAPSFSADEWDNQFNLELGQATQ